MIKNFKVKMPTKLMSILLTGVVVTGFSACKREVEVQEITSVVQSSDDEMEQNVFMDDFKSTKKLMKENKNTLLLLNVGDHLIKNESNEKDIVKANKKGIPVGLIVNCMVDEADDLAYIYEDADYVKKLVASHEIDGPVYMDVTNLISNEKLNAYQVLEYIKRFCLKMSANKIYVGICGTESDIEKLVENDENGILSAYDILYLDKDDNINLGLTSTIKNMGDGVYVTKENFQSITEGKLNSSAKFSCDLVYIPEDGKSLGDIAYKYGLSVNDLLKYNDYDSVEDYKKSDGKLIIPSRQCEKTITFSKGKDHYIGTEIAAPQWDTGNVDFEELKEKNDFLLIKATYGSTITDYVEECIKGCMENDIPMGFYCANYVPYYSDNFERAIEDEAKKTIEALTGATVSLPVCLDLEEWGTTIYITNYTADQIVAALEIWHDYILNAGYTPGIYCNQSWFEKIKRVYDNKYGEGAFAKNFVNWVAGDYDGIYYNAEYYYSNYQDALDGKIDSEGVIPDDYTCEEYNVLPEDADIIQVSKCGVGVIDGCYADIDFTKTDFLNKTETQEGAEKYLTEDYEQCSKSTIKINNFFKNLDPGTTFVLGTFAAGAIGKISKRIKKKKEEEKVLKK